MGNFALQSGFMFAAGKGVPCTILMNLVGMALLPRSVAVQGQQFQFFCCEVEACHECHHQDSPLVIVITS